MIPNEIFTEDITSTLIRYGLYFAAVFQVLCFFVCITITNEQSDTHPYEEAYTDVYSDGVYSDEYSSEQSSPGHRATVSRTRRHDKKKKKR